MQEEEIDKDAEKRMDMAQRITSQVLSIRRQEKLKVRQPLAKVMVAIMDPDLGEAELKRVGDLVAHEVNVKKIEYITEDNSILIKKIKPNFRSLGPKVGKLIKEIGPELQNFNQDDIRRLEKEGKAVLSLSNGDFEISLEDVEVLSEDIPGWAVASDGVFTVALDITVSDALAQEGIAREFVNRIQNLRKSKGFEVKDRIAIEISVNEGWNEAVKSFRNYICKETLGEKLELVKNLEADDIEINGLTGNISLTRLALN